MISYLNVKQLEALAEIPKSLVVDCNGEPVSLLCPIMILLDTLISLRPPLSELVLILLLSQVISVPSLTIKIHKQPVGLSSLMNIVFTLVFYLPFLLGMTVKEMLNSTWSIIPIVFFLSSGRMVKAKNEKFTYNFYQVSDTPTPPTLDEYSVEDKVLFIKSYEDCFPRPGFYSKFVESSSFEELNRTRKTLIDRLNVVKSRLVYLVQNDDTEDQP